METLVHPLSGKTFKLGRKPSAPREHLRLGDYLIPGPQLPVPPIVAHYSQAALHGIEMILGNDSLGDCTSAAAAHIVDLWRGNAASTLPMVTTEQAIQFYSASTGYVPGDDATDQGGDLVTCMTQWKDKGYFANGSSKLSGWASVDPTNEKETKAAIWLFENLYMGAGLPDAWLSPMPGRNGFAWTVAGAPNQSNGHCTAACGFNSVGVQILTWGMIGGITWPALAKYYAASAGGELYVLLSEEAIDRATGKAASGVDFAALRADLAAFS